MAVTLAGDAEVGQVDVGPADFAPEQPRGEEVPGTLVDAQKDLPKTSLVALQEALIEPSKLGELAPDSATEEVCDSRSLICLFI